MANKKQVKVGEVELRVLLNWLANTATAYEVGEVGKVIDALRTIRKAIKESEDNYEFDRLV